MKVKDNYKAPYFRVVTDTGTDAAEMYLYGYIGQEKWWEDDLTEPLTDLEVVKAIRDLERTHKRINIRINSPGGSVMHGDPMIAAIKNSPAEIHTYVDGMAASMAFDIWIAAKNRHAATHSKMMIHATGTIAWGNVKAMEQAAAMLKKFDETSIASMADATGMSEEEIQKQFYDYEDHWLTAKDAKEIGLIQDVEGYATTTPVPEPEKLNFRQLLGVAGRAIWPNVQDETVQTPENVKDLDWRQDYLRRRALITQNSQQ